MEKIQDVTRSFDGSGNVENWIKKIRLVAKLKEVTKLKEASNSFNKFHKFPPGNAYISVAYFYSP